MQGMTYELCVARLSAAWAWSMVGRAFGCVVLSVVCEEKLVGLCQVCARVSCARYWVLRLCFFDHKTRESGDREFYERAVK